MLFHVSFQQSTVRLNASFNRSKSQIDVDFAALQKMAEVQKVEEYTGDYVITPKVDAQTMYTAQKMMSDDLTVLGIPYFETSNNEDGETVYIGMEVEIYGD